MVTSSKVLTVTYGSFSCTLEGFDDPFTTLQKVAEYFRRLAAEDRHFGGQPQLPDSATLKAIAEANAGHDVSAELEENGVILRHSETSPSEEQPVTMFRSSRNEQEETEADEQIATAAAGIAAAGAAAAATNLQPGKRSVEETLAAIRKNVERAESEIVLPDDESEDDVDDAEVVAEVPVEDKAEKPTPPREEPVVAETAEHDPETVEDQADPAVEATAEATETADLDSTVEAEVAKSLQDDAVEEPVNVPHAEVAEPTAVEDVADAVEPMALTPDLEVAEPEASVEDAPVAEVENETPESPVEPEVEDEPDEPTTDDLQKLRDAILAADRPMTAADSVEEPVAETETAQTSVAEAAEDAPAEEVTAETIEVQVEIQEEDEDFGAGSTLSLEEEADLARALAEAVSEEDSSEPTAEESSDGYEAESEGYSEDVVDEAARLVSGIEAVSDDEDRRAERRARAAAMLGRTTDDTRDGTLDRLLETTRTKMDRPEQQRRLNALDQLKAAVAATEAENQLRAVQGRDDDREPAELTAFRRDLDEADTTPAKSERPGRPSIRPAQVPTAAPLILVSEQRIGESSEPQPKFSEDYQEVATTDGNLALQPAQDDMSVPEIEEFADEVQGIPADAFQTASFPDFAERVGAFDMHDLLEAAAAYTTIVEGHERFSRAEVMNKISGLNHADGYSKEQGLRAFGKLLREGKILRVQDGHFAIARSSRFSVASRDGH